MGNEEKSEEALERIMKPKMEEMEHNTNKILSEKDWYETSSENLEKARRQLSEENQKRMELEQTLKRMDRQQQNLNEEIADRER